MPFVEDMNAIWQIVSEKFRPEMDISTYNLWFGDVEVIAYDDVNKIITLGTNNNLKLNVLRERYLEKINERFSALVGFDLKVFAVLKETPKPVFIAEDGDAHEKTLEYSGNNVNNFSFNYTFENFIVGDTNKFAFAACQAIVDHPADTYNPLFIYGPSGLGKTHLLRAVINAMMQKKPGLNVVYVKCEDFINEMVAALAKKGMNEFHNKFRRCDVLLIDDIQFIDGKEATQDEFFHTFNTLFENHKQIILTSDRPPKDINQLAERLRSRFEWGLIADIQPPNLELRIAIFKKKAEQVNVFVPDDVLEYLAENLRSNIRQIEGAITKLSALSIVLNQPINISMAQNCIMELLGGAEPVNVTIDKIFKVIENHYHVDKETLIGNKQTKEIAKPRHYAIYMVRKITDISFPNIGKLFGGRDHSTIHSAYNNIEKTINIDPAFALEMENMMEEVKGNKL